MIRLARGPLRWWDGATTAVLVAAVVFVLLDDDALPLRYVSLGLVGAMAVMYVVLGRNALRRGLRDEVTSPADRVFLVALIGIVGAATAVKPSLATMQVIAYPMIWTVVQRYAHAVAWNVALALTAGASIAVAYARYGILDDRAIEVVAIAALSLMFSLAMGTWVTQIVERGEEHRRLAQQLRDAQAEVSALSQAAGAAAERERLSRELHDTLTQTLTGMVMLTDQAARALDDGDQARARSRIDRVREASREAMAEARALVATTQPLRDGGLVQALERVGARLREDTGLVVDMALESVDTDREREVVLLRAAQEGLANARRHAHAARVVVCLSVDGGTVVLSIDDDGVGPAGGFADPSALAGAAGYGLEGLGDRVRIEGGTLSFGPSELGGSRLLVRVPLSKVESSNGEIP